MRTSSPYRTTKYPSWCTPIRAFTPLVVLARVSCRILRRWPALASRSPFTEEGLTDSSMLFVEGTLLGQPSLGDVPHRDGGFCAVRSAEEEGAVLTYSLQEAALLTPGRIDLHFLPQLAQACDPPPMRRLAAL